MPPMQPVPSMVLLRDQDLERMGRKGREIAEKKFSEDIVVQQYLTVLREIEKSDSKVVLCP